MTTKNGNLPAMPQTNDDNLCMQTGTAKSEHAGLTKREMFAMHFAGHIWTQYQTDGTAVQYDNWREGVCVESIRLADQLLAELEATK
jgi:hypothetical protein